MKNKVFINRKTLYVILCIILISVFSLTIAYAALSTVLTINGNAQVSSASWDVCFKNIKVNSGSVSATKTPTIVNSKTIDFSVELNQPGEFYKFSVDIANQGTVDAMIENIIKSPELTEEQAKYLKYEIQYSDGNSISSNQLLSKGTTKTINILLLYRTDLNSTELPEGQVVLDLSFTLDYIQADESSVSISDSVPVVRVINGDLNTIGSEVAIGDEHFYITKNNGSSVNLLAKYNLYVGYYVPNGMGSLKLNDETGIQNELAKGYLGDSSVPWYGVVEFSSNVYWTIPSGYYSKYVFNSQASSYKYISNYKDYLESLGILIKEARLIGEDELKELGCTDYGCTNSPSWVYSTSYWTGSSFGVGNDIYVYGVSVDGSFGGLPSFVYGRFGLRPLIEISLSEF